MSDTLDTIPIRIRKIDEESKQKFLLFIQNIDWANTLKDLDPESAFSDFFTFINMMNASLREL